MKMGRQRYLTNRYITLAACWLVLVLLLAVKKLWGMLACGQKDAAKYEQLYKLMVQWMEVKQSGQSIGAWLRENGYGKVAIYGLYFIGERLYVELLDENVDVVYGIDRKPRDKLEGLKMYRPDDELPHADIVIVTAAADFAEIKKGLQGKIKGTVMSIKEVLDEVAVQ